MHSYSPKLILYGTEGCHLCDEARDLLDLVLISKQLSTDYPYIDIADNDVLMNQYGTTIPVIKAVDSCIELAWPFDQKELFKFLDVLS